MDFEIKFGGYRCVAVKRARKVTLFSRHQKVHNRRFPSVAQAIASLDDDFVLDGELVALDSPGMPLFQIGAANPRARRIRLSGAKDNR